MKPGRDGKVSVDVVIEVHGRITNAMSPAEAADLEPEQVAHEVLGWHGGIDLGAIDSDPHMRIVRVRRVE